MLVLETIWPNLRPSKTRVGARVHVLAEPPDARPDGQKVGEAGGQLVHVEGHFDLPRQGRRQADEDGRVAASRGWPPRPWQRAR